MAGYLIKRLNSTKSGWIEIGDILTLEAARLKRRILRNQGGPELEDIFNPRGHPATGSNNVVVPG